MYISVKTAEIGDNLGYVMKNLVGRDYRNRLFLNLRWRKVKEGREYFAQKKSLVKSTIQYIRQHRAMQIALVLAAIGDCVIWLSILA